MTDIPGNQPPQGYPPPPYPPPPYPPQAYPPVGYSLPKKGPSALKIVLIIVAIVVGLGLIGVGFVSYEVYKVAKSGHFATSTQPVSAADLGVDLYPGADQKMNVRMTIAGKDTLTATFLSSDSKDQVIAYYQNSLGSKAQFQANNNGGTFVLDKGSGETVIVTISQQPSMSGGQMQIVIVHATSAAAPSK
jgi:hypothetical protein